MNDKLALQDLVEILSKKAKITKKEADLFFRELFQLILDRIFENDSVKIKDFGTFKLTSVSSRESVNVNTGEKIQIPAHSRLSFSPDKTLKDLVNKPFSQFETILLEDGAVIDSIDLDVDEEDELSSYQEESEVQEVVLQTDSSEVKTPESVESKLVSDSKIKEEPQEILEEVKPVRAEEKKDTTSQKEEVSSQSRVNNPYSSKSFVYTYTTASSDDSGVITLTFPKEDLIIVPDDQVIVNDSEVEEKVIESDDYSSEEQVQEIEHSEVKEEVRTVVYPTENSEEEVIDEPTLNDDNHPDIIEEEDELEIELELDSEIETEEDIVMPPVIVPRTVVDETKKPFSDSIDKEATLSKDIDDPERPLVPLDEFIDEIESDEDVSLEPEERSVINRPMPVNNARYENINHIDAESVEDLDLVEDVDNSPYYDYNKPTLGAKIMKKLPIIIFVAIVACFTVYGFFKLFDVKYDYEYYLGNKDLTLADTLPFVDEKIESVTKSSDTLTTLSDTTENMEINLEAPAHLLNEETVVEPDTQSLAPMNQEAEPVNDNGFGKIGRVISDRLRIDVINKGAFHIKRQPKVERVEESVPVATVPVETQSKNVAPEKKPASKAVYVTMQRGTTLRTMATKYYGNPNYWVYIYQANRTKLSNPNDIAIGMKLLVPDLSNYGVSDVKDAREIQKAKRLEAQLLKW